MPAVVLRPVADCPLKTSGPGYQGGKNDTLLREGIADAIAELVDEHPRKTELKTYLAPCVGMLNVMLTLVTNDNLPSIEKWLADEINPDVVALLQAAIATGSDSLPNLDAFTKASYEQHATSSKDADRKGSAERAFYGLATTYSNIFFNNNWNGNMTRASGDRPYKLGNFRKGLDNLRAGWKDAGVAVECRDLFARETPPTNTVIYVDPRTGATRSTRTPTLGPGTTILAYTGTSGS